jgi:hypothetical protein
VATATAKMIVIIRIHFVAAGPVAPEIGGDTEISQ